MAVFSDTLHFPQSNHFLPYNRFELRDCLGLDTPDRKYYAIAFDAAANGADDDASSFNIGPLTVGTGGANRLLVVGVSLLDTTLGDRQVGTVEWRRGASGTQSLTQAIEIDNPNNHAEIWYLVAPTTGTGTVFVYTARVVSGPVGGAISYTGVDQTSPIDAIASGTGAGTLISGTITTIADNAWIVDNVSRAATGAGTMTAATGRTQRWNRLDSPFSEAPRSMASDQGAISPAGATVMQWTGGSQVWAWTAISLAPAAEAGGEVSKGNLLLLGVG